MGRFTFLDSIAVADCAVDVEGQDLGDLFATAARALAELTVDPATVPVTVTRTLELSAPAPDLLLFDWLSELIYLKDRERLVVTAARVDVRVDSPCTLTAQVEGGVIEPGRTAVRADPKAVTFHRFRLESGPDGWRARLVIDI